MFPWGDNRRFNAYSRHCRENYGGRIQKLPVDAGFSCPNRASRTHGGCTYCANEAFTPAYVSANDDVAAQLENGKRFFQKRYPSNNGYFAYFQSFTNTNASVDILRKKFEEALQVADIKGLVISTRPDCLPDAVLDYLSELNARTHLTVELGVESLHDETLAHIRRGHDTACTRQAFRQLREREIPVCAHLILGLPNETPSIWLNDIQKINQLGPQFIKFHQLQIFKKTAMETEFEAFPERFHTFTAIEYARFMADCLERLLPEIVVERFSAEAPPRYLAVSRWQLHRHDALVRDIETELASRNSWQGKNAAQ